MLLAIDTSTRNASVALFNEGVVLAEITWQSAQNHSRELMPNITAATQQAKIGFTDLTAVIIARGPGSFSALRVGMSAAKGLALALSIPIVSVSTLTAIAYQQIAASLPLCAVLGAGRDEVAFNLFKKRRGQLHALGEEQIIPVETLARLVSNKTIFCGEIDEKVSTTLRDLLGNKALFLPAVTSYRRAGFVADLGWQRLQAGEVDSLETLQPVYLRRPTVGGRPG